MNSDPSPKRKMSEMISEMAAGFIGVGKTPEEKHHRLTAACTRLEHGLRIRRKFDGSSLNNTSKDTGKTIRQPPQAILPTSARTWSR